MDRGGLDAVETLIQEHHLARRVLAAALGALAPFNVVRLKRSLHFLKYVVDRVHHAKEEDALFPALLANSDGRERARVEEIQRQHGQGHAHLKSAEALLAELEQGSAEALQPLARAIEAYAEHTTEHMRREEQELFPLAAEILTPLAHADLLTRFAAVQALLISPHDLALYFDFAKEPGRTETLVMGGADPRSAPMAEEDQLTRVIQHGRTLHSKGPHRSVLLTTAAGTPAAENHHLIIDGTSALLILSGGRRRRPDLAQALRHHLERARIEYLCFGGGRDAEISAQDLGCSERALVVLASDPSAVTAPGIPVSAVRALPEGGGVLTLGNSDLAVLPAHFLSAPSDHHFYDPIAKVLYSGELGAAIGGPVQVTADFESHVPNLAALHQRRLANRATVRAWSAMIRQLDVRVLVPHRGALLIGEAIVASFLDWCEATPCGTDLLEGRYEVPTQSLPIGESR